jgi:Ca2+ transporting ATPase
MCFRKVSRAVKVIYNKERKCKFIYEIILFFRYGSNAKRPPKIRTLCELILENFEDKILQLLLLAAFVSLVIGIINDGWAHGWVEGMSIFIAVFIIVSVTAGNNYIKEK